RTRRAPGLLPAFALAALAAALFLSWRSGIAPRLANEQLVLAGAALAPQRLFAGVIPLLKETLSSETWGASALLFAAVLAAGLGSLLRRRNLPLVVLCGALLALDVAAILLSPVEVGLIVRTAWSRLLLQAVVPLSMVFAIALSGALGSLSRRA